MSIGDKLYNRRKELGLTLEEVGKLVGVGKSTVRKWETGYIENMKRDKIALLAQALRVTPSYIMGWDNPNDFPPAKNILPLPATKTIPLIGSIACGTPILAEQNIEDFVKAPEGINADFCLRCVGDSMIDARIMDGDLVFIRQQPEVDNGAIAAVLIDEEATLKRVHREGNRLMLQAANSAYPPMIYINGELESIRVIGKAVAFLSAIK